MRTTLSVPRSPISAKSSTTLMKPGVEMMLCAGTSTLCAICNMRMMLAAALRQAQAGQETKMELVYQYLTSPKVRHRVEAIVGKIDIAENGDGKAYERRGRP